MLGTDGIGGDMLAEARAAWFVSRDRQAGLSPHDMLRMLAAPARRASSALGVTLGRLSGGAAADVVITDYLPPTPLTSDNLVGHVLFGLAARHVRHVITAGHWAMRERTAVRCDEPAVRRAARASAPSLWARMAHF
jgi:cytosine/adenosine deaminase-related metal-dependent hydrolase